MRRRLADIEHFLAEPLGWREGVVVVWAGMRGAVTLAAALLDARDDGAFSADALDHALAVLDAEQIGIELRR